MKLSAEIRDFESRLGHRFGTPELLARALTHSSLSSDTRPDNQRLEFLGDRVLGLVMAEALLEADAGAREGQLAPRDTAQVRHAPSAEVARAIGQGEAQRLGRSEMLAGGRRKEALLADAHEAVIAAIYLDAGFAAARDAVLRLWGRRIAEVETDARDPKTALQEWAQARGMAPPAYVEQARTGPDHAPVFTIVARLETGAEARAAAGSKREAQMQAARALLERLQTSDAEA